MTCPECGELARGKNIILKLVEHKAGDASFASWLKRGSVNVLKYTGPALKPTWEGADDSDTVTRFHGCFSCLESTLAMMPFTRALFKSWFELFCDRYEFKADQPTSTATVEVEIHV